MIDWTDDELKERIRKKAGNETYPVLLAELNRRSQERHADTGDALAAIGIASTNALVRFSAALAAATTLLAYATFMLAGFTVASWTEGSERIVVVTIFAVAGTLASAAFWFAAKRAA